MKQLDLDDIGLDFDTHEFTTYDPYYDDENKYKGKGWKVVGYGFRDIGTNYFLARKKSS